MRQLLDVRETLTPADHQTHRQYRFVVPDRCKRLEFQIIYGPKYLDEDESSRLAWSALRAQMSHLASRVGERLAAGWAADLSHRAERVRIPNLLTLSLDDPNGVYRGAAHRQSADQTLFVTSTDASPGLVPGPLPAGEWILVLSAHTLVSPECQLSIQIGAEVPTRTP